MKVKKKTTNEQLSDLVEEYRASGQKWPTDTSTVAAWAIKNRKWDYFPDTKVRRLARMLATAMREQRFMDPQGRRPRLKHAFPELQIGPDGAMKQVLMWQDLPKMSHEQMDASTAHQRNQILGHCAQLKLDVDSYNENYNAKTPIEPSFDFTEDLIEREQPTRYEGLDSDEDD